MPDPEQVRQTVMKSRRRRQELKLACLELEEWILKLETENIQRRKTQLEKALHSN